MKIDKVKVRNLMAHKLMTMRDLSEAAGLGSNYIATLLSGVIDKPRPATLKKICKALDCTIDDIIEDNQ